MLRYECEDYIERGHAWLVREGKEGPMPGSETVEVFVFIDSYRWHSESLLLLVFSNEGETEQPDHNLEDYLRIRWEKKRGKKKGEGTPT